MRNLFNSILLLLATTTPALAATEVGGDNYLGVFAFMGFVAVLFVMQGLPVIFMIYGVAKSLFTKTVESVVKA